MNQFTTKPMRASAISKAVLTRRKNLQEKRIVSFFRQFYLVAIMSLITANAIIGYYGSLQALTTQTAFAGVKTPITQRSDEFGASEGMQECVFKRLEAELGL